MHGWSTAPAATTLRNLTVAVTLLALAQWLCLHTSVGDVWDDVYRTYLHRVLSHRLTEGSVSVLSFAVSSLAFTALEVLGAPELLTAKIKSNKTVSGSRGGAQQLGTPPPALLQGRSVNDGSVVNVGVRQPQFARWRGFDLRRLKPKTGTNFGFWLALNVGLYMGIVDLSQRLLGRTIDSLHYAAEDPPSPLRMVVEVLFSVWAYDFLFWGIHWTWHGGGQKSTNGGDVSTTPTTAVSLYGRLVGRWRRLHLLHHDNYKTATEPLHPMATFHHHFLDAALQVQINIVVQQIPLFFLFSGPRHKLSKVLHNIVVTYLLVEAHSGFDLSFMSHRLFPSIFGGSVRHQVHHQLGGLYFHQFFRYLDDAFYSVRSNDDEAVEEPQLAKLRRHPVSA